MPRLKRFLSEVKEGVVPQTLWKFEDVGHTQESKKELIEYVKFENTDNVIDSVKPTRLIKKLLKIGTRATNNDIVMDFFLGTGTTAHAVLALNAEDGGSRRFIGIQLPEPLIVPERGLKTIADVARRRVSQVVAELSTASQEALPFEKMSATGIGFRLYRLDQSSFTTWDAGIEHEPETLERQLELHIEHIRDGRTDDDILYEMLLKSGYPLTAHVEKQSLAGKTVYNVAGGLFIICLERELTLDLIRAISERKPERVVLLDEGFAGNDQLKANAVQTFKTKGITAFKTV
jgi:adenine-specific DNA-methyltransferase